MPQQAQLRLIRALNLRFAVLNYGVARKSFQRHLHIRLARSKPDIADHHVVDTQIIRPLHIHRKWAARRMRRQIQTPFAQLVRCRAAALPV